MLSWPIGGAPEEVEVEAAEAVHDLTQEERGWGSGLKAAWGCHDPRSRMRDLGQAAIYLVCTIDLRLDALEALMGYQETWLGIDKLIFDPNNYRFQDQTGFYYA